MSVKALKLYFIHVDSHRQRDSETGDERRREEKRDERRLEQEE